MIKGFTNEMKLDGSSISTISGYVRNVEQYFEWYRTTYNGKCDRLYRVNILDYISYLKDKGLSPKTINHKIASLIKYNTYLISIGIQDEMVISGNDRRKIQTTVASPTDITVNDVEEFRQRIMEQESIRDYTIVTLLAYAGLRISECLNLNIGDISVKDRTIQVIDSKGNKYRVVYMSDKVQNALREYMDNILRVDDGAGQSEIDKGNMSCLFISNRGTRLDRTVVNRMFNKHSDTITPHTLRHFFCTRALESGLAIHEVANQAGHSNINTTLQYTNPSVEEMKNKMSRL